MKTDLQFYNSCVKELLEKNPDAILFNDLEGALIGIASQSGAHHVAVYDYDLIISCLIEQGSSEEDAIDEYHYNIVGGYYGPNTPFIIERPVLMESEIE